MNTDCQPNRSMAAAASSPPRAPPSEKPHTAIATIMVRARVGA